MSLENALKGREQYSDQLLFPGTDIWLRFRPLTDEDIQQARKAAYDRFKKLDMPTDGLQFADMFEDENAIQILARACVESKSKHQFTTADEVRKFARPQERADLITQWVDYQLSIGLSDHNGHIDVEVLKEIDEAIKKKDTARLRGFGSSVLANFIVSMAHQPAT